MGNTSIKGELESSIRVQRIQGGLQAFEGPLEGRQERLEGEMGEGGEEGGQDGGQERGQEGGQIICYKRLLHTNTRPIVYSVCTLQPPGGIT